MRPDKLLSTTVLSNNSLRDSFHVFSKDIICFIHCKITSVAEKNEQSTTPSRDLWNKRMKHIKKRYFEKNNYGIGKSKENSQKLLSGQKIQPYKPHFLIQDFAALGKHSRMRLEGKPKCSRQERAVMTP